MHTNKPAMQSANSPENSGAGALRSGWVSLLIQAYEDGGLSVGHTHSCPTYSLVSLWSLMSVEHDRDLSRDKPQS